MRILLTLLYIGIASGLMVSCGGSDPTVKSRAQDLLTKSTAATSSSGSVTGGPISSTVTPNPSLRFLDCTKLDPDKVYLLGSFGGGYQALIDPENPPLFCVYFPGVSENLATISKSGSLLYKAKDIYRKTKNDLLGGSEFDGSAARWFYPADAYKDDTLLFNATTDDAFKRKELFTRYDPTTNSDQVYSQSNDKIFFHGTSDLPYIDKADGTMLGVMPDGSLLMDGNSGLYLIDPTLKITKLTFPSSGSFIFHRSKLFTNSATGGQNAWILVENQKEFSRWSLDLTTNTIKDDGLFVPLPSNISLDEFTDYGSSRLNGIGDLIQIGFDSTQTVKYNYLVMKRPLVSSGQATSILYRDSDYPGNFGWGIEPNPFVHIQDGSLVIGP
jgi:hypothetical protein